MPLLPGPTVYPGGAIPGEPPQPLHPRTELWLEDLPPFMANSPTIQATLDVIAREAFRLESAAALIRQGFVASYAPGNGHVSDIDPESQQFPYAPVDDLSLLGQMPPLAGDMLALFETTFNLTAANKTETQRQQALVAYLQGLQNIGTGSDWEDALTRLAGTGWTYQEHDPADSGSPPAYEINIRVPYGDQLAAPAAPTATPSTAAGSLAAGSYVYAISALNSYGETTVSPAATATLTATGEVALSWTAVTGATGYMIYRGPDAGSLQKLESVGVVTSFTDDGTVAPLGGAPPSANTTKSLQAYEVGQLARALTPAHVQINMSYGAGFIVGVSQVGDFI